MRPIDVWDHYDHEFLPALLRPRDDDTGAAYLQRIAKRPRAVREADTLFTFLISEVCSEEVDDELARVRLDRAIADIQGVRRSIRRVSSRGVEEVI